MGRGEYSTFSAAVAIHTVPILRSTWYPLLLLGQRRCGFKACPRLLHMTGAAGIEPRTARSRVQRLNRSRPCAPEGERERERERESERERDLDGTGMFAGS